MCVPLHFVRSFKTANVFAFSPNPRPRVAGNVEADDATDAHTPTLDLIRRGSKMEDGRWQRRRSFHPPSSIFRPPLPAPTVRTCPSVAPYPRPTRTTIHASYSS